MLHVWVVMQCSVGKTKLPACALQDVFMEAADLLERAAACPEHASGVAAQQGIMRQLEPAGQLLVRKVDVEAKYLNRLEGM